MKTSTPPRPTIDLAPQLYYQLVYTLTDLLPPPLDNTPEALRTRNLAAIAKVAALLPVNANEADLAAQCIAARAQAEDLLRLLRQHADDIALVLRLNAQYGSMVRTSLSVHGRLMRAQAARQKREAIEGAATDDAWTLQVAERSMLGVVAPSAEPVKAAWPASAPIEAWPGPAPVEAPAGPAPIEAWRGPAPIEAPAASAPIEAWPASAPIEAWPASAPIEAWPAPADPRTQEIVSETNTSSHQTAFETKLSGQPGNRQSTGSGQPGKREAMAEQPLTGRESPERPDRSRLSPNHRMARKAQRGIA